MVELFSTGNDNLQKMRFSTLTGDEKWKDIEDLMNRWARRNPKGAYEMEMYIKEMRASLTDKKYGVMGGKADKETGITNRIGVAIHPELMSYIHAFYPTFMDSKDDLHEFKKRFPKFRIAESF